MAAMQRLPQIRHLAVNIGFDSEDRDSMPPLHTEQQWLDFIGMNHLNVGHLQSVCCNDDSFLRYITSLCAHRELGQHLQWQEEIETTPMRMDSIPDPNANGLTSPDSSYEKGSLLHHRADRAMQTAQIHTEEIEEEDGDNEAILGHFVRVRTGSMTKFSEFGALQFVRYDSPPFEAEVNFTGIEFDGAVIVEVSPYENMDITIPQSVISFRISPSTSFYEEPDDFKVVIPHSNRLRQLCLHHIEFGYWSIFIFCLVHLCGWCFSTFFVLFVFILVSVPEYDCWCCADSFSFTVPTLNYIAIWRGSAVNVI